MATRNLYDNQKRFYASSFNAAGAVQALNDEQAKVAAVHLSLAGGVGSAFVTKVTNPVDSGVEVFISSIAINTDIAQQFRFVDNAVPASPTTAITPARNLSRAGADTTALTVQYDEVALTSGDDFPGRYQVAAGTTEILADKNVKLSPGDSIAVVGNSEAAQETGVHITYLELPL